MVSEKSIIERIGLQKSNYTSPESAQDQANSLESLSIDIYTDSSRFIYELLQNADDASYGSGKLDMFLTIVGKYLIVAHQGEAFSEVDIESICSVGDGNKKGDENKTGFKGIGFKSVFSLSNLVIINSGNYCFRFDKDHWSNYWNKHWGNESDWKATRKDKSKEEEVKMPWQIIPIWTSLESSFSFLHQYNVSTIIGFEDESKLENELFELFSNPQILLFLRSQEVKISIQGPKNLALEKIKLDNTIRLKKNGEDISTWLLKSFVLPIDSGTINSIKNDVRIPKKLRQATKTEISFAIQLEDNKIKIADKKNRLVYSYLPTSVNYDFPFLVNGSFITDAGRQHLHEDFPWNIWLFQQIPCKLFEWLSELAKTPHKSEVLKLIPNKLPNSIAINQAFNRGFDQAIITIAFIPNIEGELLKVSEAIFDKTGLSGIINQQTIVNYINLKGKNYLTLSFIPYLGSIDVLKRLGVKIFEMDDLDGFFISSVFTNEHNLEENSKLIAFLYEQATLNTTEDGRNIWNDKFKRIPFIMDESQKLKAPQTIYFPTLQVLNDFNEDLAIIHNKTMSFLASEPKIKNWLELLGVREPSDINFIEKTIITQEDFVTIDNAVQVGRYLFKAHSAGLLLHQHYEALQGFKLLTKEGSLICAINSYLSNFYEPTLNIENVCNTDFFISDYYCENMGSKIEWKVFLMKIGVNETISWIEKRLSRRELESKYPLYFQGIPSGVPNQTWGYPNDFSAYKINLISFIELAIDISFSKNFWKVVFRDEIPIKKGIDIGIGYYNSPIGSLNEWIIFNLPIIPTTQNTCLVPSKVYSPAIIDIKEIAGSYLPVFDFSDAIPPEWLEYLKLKSHLGLDEYLQILEGIWLNTDLDEFKQRENQKRVSIIYEKISCLNLHPSAKEKIRYWGKMNKILARDGIKFLAPNELTVVTKEGEGFKAPNLAFVQQQTPEIIELLRLLGVHIIDKVIPSISNSKVEIKGLKQKLIQISPLVALVSVEKSKSPKEWDVEYRRINNKLTDIHFYETSEIYLSYGTEDDKQKRSSWADGDNFYYVGDWSSPRVLDGLVEPLGKFLNIRYAQRILTVLLLETFKDGLEFLIEKGFDDSLIPDELLNPIEPQVQNINQFNRAYNQSDEDLGNKGEKFVFEELKRIYTSKYKQSAVETSTGFKIPGSVEVFWRNIASNTTENHDFKVVELGKDIYIDSKATPYSKNVEKVALYISGNELSLMETAEKYLIARVFNVTTKPEMELIKLEVTELARQKPMYNIIV